MLSCRETTQLISKSMDDRLAPAERLAVAVHLKICEACTRYRAQLRFLRKLVRAGLRLCLTADALPEIGVPGDIRARILNALAAEGASRAD